MNINSSAAAGNMGQSHGGLAPQKTHQQHKSNASSASSTSLSHSTAVVGSHYKIGRKIGEGSFGVIYEGIPSELLNLF